MGQKQEYINKISYNKLTKREFPREQDVRSPYYRDSTAIMHSMPFRRLKHKTQVFFAPKNDHICTRIEHSMHVASISGSIAGALGLDNELVWAIGLGHDCGHTPFGHVGETVLKEFWDEVKTDRDPEFQHELLSLRTHRYTALGTKGLNLTYAVLDGIVSHCGEAFSHKKMMPTFEIKDFDSIKDRKTILPSTWEGVVVRYADSIAYLGRDTEDAAREHLISLPSDLPYSVRKYLGCTNGEIINSLVNNLIVSSTPDEGIGYSDDIADVVKEFVDFNYTHIYKSEFLNRETEKRKRLLSILYSYMNELYDAYLKDSNMLLKENTILSNNFKDYLDARTSVYKERGEGRKELVFDYIAGMTDTFAIDALKMVVGI